MSDRSHSRTGDASPPDARRPLVQISLFWIVLGLAACASESVPQPKVPVDPNLWDTAWAESSESQRAALADGALTFEEYEAAALRAVQCVNEHGMRGEAILDAQSHVYSVGARWEAPFNSEMDKQNKAASDKCYEEHWNGISQAWSAQNQPSEQLLAQARAALASCLREAGVELPEPASAADIQQHHNASAFFPCVEKVDKEFGIPNFAG